MGDTPHSNNPMPVYYVHSGIAFVSGFAASNLKLNLRRKYFQALSQKRQIELVRNAMTDVSIGFLVFSFLEQLSSTP